MKDLDEMDMVDDKKNKNENKHEKEKQADG